MTDISLLTESFRSLASLVREFELRGKVCRGAALKQRYQSRFPLTSERTLGFNRFGDFLRAAQSAGFIRVAPHPGVDLEISLPSASTKTSPTSLPSGSDVDGGPPLGASRREAIRIRPDLWKAFNAPPLAYGFSRERNLAIRQDSHQEGLPSLVPIPSVQDSFREWMKDFVSAHSDELGSSLVETLQQMTNRHQFALKLRDSPNMFRLWQNDYTFLVRAAIENWASENHIQIPDLAVPLSATRASLNPRPGDVIGNEPRQPDALEGELSLFAIREELERKCIGQIDQLIQNLLQLHGVLSILNRRA